MPKERMTEHRNNKVNGITSDKILQHGEGYIELLEDYPCNNRKELALREGYYMNLYKDKCINKLQAGRTKKESARLDYLKNIERYKKQAQESKIRNKERNKEILTCECGSKVKRYSMSSHKKSLIHINFINNQ
jgi:gluconate kinase